MSSQDIRIQLDLKIPMRDGVRLYGACTVPLRAINFGAAYPISLQHPTPTLCGLGGALRTERLRSGDAGLRGRYDSEGVWRPYIDETNDGYDTQQWLGAQPWCDGNIGTFASPIPDLRRFYRRHSEVRTSRHSSQSPTKRTTMGTCDITVSCSFRTP